MNFGIAGFYVIYKSTLLLINKSDNKNNFLILVFYHKRSIINQCHYMVDKYFYKMELILWIGLKKPYGQNHLS